MNKVLKIIAMSVVVIAVFILIITLAFTSSDKTAQTGTEIASEANPESSETSLKILTDSLTLQEAQAKIGMDCIGSDVSMECQWNGVEYDVYVVQDWEEAQRINNFGCDEGYINRGYNMVSDGATWYATTDFEKDNNSLEVALNNSGLMSDTIPFCE
jgi:hypothetical protein